MADKIKDDLLYCEHCGISFLWANEEQKRVPAAAVPTRCPACRRLAAEQGRERGMVKWFNQRKHFGFIVRRNADELFFPATEVKSKRRLVEGDLVEFTLGSNAQGAVAREVTFLASKSKEESSTSSPNPRR